MGGRELEKQHPKTLSVKWLGKITIFMNCMLLVSKGNRGFVSYCSLSSVDVINALFSVYVYISMDGIWCELCKYFTVSLLNIRSDVTML